MMYHTTGNLTNVKNNASFDFGVAMLPANESFGSPTGGGNFYIFKGVSEERQQAAFDFIKWMTDDERVAQWSIDTGYVATRPSAYDTERMQEYAEEFPYCPGSKRSAGVRICGAVHLQSGRGTESH